MRNQANAPQVTVNFEGWMGRSAYPASAFPQDLFQTDPKTALKTIAFYFSHFDTKRIQSTTCEIVLLALYAAGARVRLTSEDMMFIRREPRKWANVFRQLATLNEGNGPSKGDLIAFAIDRANERPTLPGDGIYIGHKFISASRDLAEPGFLLRDEEEALLTVAFLCTNYVVSNNRSDLLAVAMLATWASGAAIALTAEQYEQLRALAQQVPASTDDLEYSAKSRYATFALACAERRARLDGLVQ